MGNSSEFVYQSQKALAQETEVGPHERVASIRSTVICYHLVGARVRGLGRFGSNGRGTNSGLAIRFY